MTTIRRPAGLNRRPMLALMAGAALALAGGSVMAQAWPQAKPITFVVPFTAGSGTDIIARTLAEQLTPVLGQQIVVENRPGAGGTIGAGQVARAEADGYTYLIHSSGHVVNPALYPRLPYDTLKDLEGVAPLASLPNVLVVPPGKGYKDVADLVAQVKARPGAMNYASAGNGSATHMNAEQFRVAAGIDAVHVPFRGTPEAITETIAGRTDWFFAPLVSALPHIRAGRLQALAVGTAERSAALPEAPSIVEAGLPDAAYTFWVGMFTTAGAPRAAVERMHTEVARAMGSAAMKERLERLGANAMSMTQAEFAKSWSTRPRRRPGW
jgi:tripartite-type tricarboxylate transporter receptor subunit TctC